VTAALTAPADVVIVPRSDAPVRWTVRETVGEDHHCTPAVLTDERPAEDQ
jgi:hypothetical protein